MPSTAKRALEKGSGNQGPSQKRQAKAKGKMPATAATTAADDNNDDESRKPRISRGPNGEEFLPTIFPPRFRKALENNKVNIPASLVDALDGTPQHQMTIGSRVWWESHGKWLAKNGTALGVTAAERKRRDKVLAAPYEAVEEDQGTFDSEFVCICRPRRDVERAAGSDEEASKSPKIPVDAVASAHPEHTWIVTMLGNDRRSWWIHETLRRDPDEFDIYEYNDYRWHGGTEVMQNLVGVFSCEST